MTGRAVRSALLALALAVPLAACGSDAEPTAAPAEQSTPGQSTPGAGEPTTQACETREPTAEPDAAISTDLSEAPEVPASEEPPPCGLVIGDVVAGSGAEAVEGSTAEVKYVGAFYETGEQFDSSWSRGPEETLPVQVGAGGVIPGFEQAVSGMQVGGRRVVTIPSDLGYGDQGVGPIPPGATLVFVLDLVSVTP